MTGRIYELTYPTGGYAKYTYASTFVPNGSNYGIDCTNFFVPTLTRTQGDGETWTYNITVSGSTLTNKVEDQNGNYTVYVFTLAGTYPAIAEIVRYQGSSNMLTDDRYSYAAWSSTVPTSASVDSAAVNFPVNELVVYHQLYGMTTWSATDTQFDAYGNVTYKGQYDFGGSSPARTVTITYGTCSANCATLSPTISSIGNNVNDKPGEVVVAQSGSTVAQTNFTYSTTSGAAGNLLSSQVWNGNSSTSFIGQTTSNVYQTGGEPTKLYDLNNNETDLTYSSGGYSDTNGCSGQTAYPFPTLLPNNWGALSTGNVFNNGSTDLLVSGEPDVGDGNIPGTIYQFQPSGTFSSQGQAPAYSTFLVDLNGDGIADMVAFYGSDLLIWKGDGSGVFQAPIKQIPLPYAYSPISFRDMDGDGYIDIVLPGTILYGKGNFQFEAATIPLYQNFAVGDFDGDGIPDIATPSGVMFGEGNRNFTAPMGACPLGNNPPVFPTEVVVDINGDGKDDLVFGEAGPAIYLSMGRRGFELDQVLVLSGGDRVSPSSLAVADLNGDGLLDLAVGMMGADDLTIFTNDGTGKYKVTTYAVGINSVDSVSADFNADGKPDLAFRGYDLDFEPPTVTVLLHQ